MHSNHFFQIEDLKGLEIFDFEHFLFSKKIF
jgi:hypothetical protein